MSSLPVAFCLPRLRLTESIGKGRNFSQIQNEELADTFAQEFQTDEDRPAFEPDRFTGFTPRGSNGDTGTEGRVASPVSVPRPSGPVASAPEAKLTFARSETSAIARTIEQHFASKAGEEAPTPWFIRSFLFKYQLARMILQMGDRTYSPVEIADELACAMQSSNRIANDSRELDLVVQQVA